MPWSQIIWLCKPKSVLIETVLIEGFLSISIIDYSSPVCFLLIEFHCSFSKYCHIIFIIIVFWLGSVVVIGHWHFFFLVSTLLIFILRPLFIPLSVSLSYSIFAVPMHEYLEGTRAWVAISYSHNEWYLIFFAKWDGLLGLRVSCQKLTIIIIGWLCTSFIHCFRELQPKE